MHNFSKRLQEHMTNNLVKAHEAHDNIPAYRGKWVLMICVNGTITLLGDVYSSKRNAVLDSVNLSKRYPNDKITWLMPIPYKPPSVGRRLPNA